jgi:hypothetical protein
MKAVLSALQRAGVPVQERSEQWATS